MLAAAPPRAHAQTTSVSLGPEMAEPPRANPTKPAAGPSSGFHIHVPIRPMARRFTGGDGGLAPTTAPLAPTRRIVTESGAAHAATVGGPSPPASSAAGLAPPPAVVNHAPPVRPPTMAGLRAPDPGSQGFGPPPNPTSNTAQVTEGAMVGLLLDFWSGPGMRDPARPVTPPLDAPNAPPLALGGPSSVRVRQPQAVIPKLNVSTASRSVKPEFKETLRRGPKSMAKLKHSRCTVRPERQKMGRGEGGKGEEVPAAAAAAVEEEAPQGPVQRARTDKLALGAIYAQLYERVPFTNACEETLARIFSDKELRVLMGMNKMTINNFNPTTKKYTEKTKQDKIRELIPMMQGRLLVLPEEQARFPAARLRRTGNPASMGGTKARRSRPKDSRSKSSGKRRRTSSDTSVASRTVPGGAAASSVPQGLPQTAVPVKKRSHHAKSESSHRRKHRATGKTTALILGKRPTVSEELSEYADVSLDKLDERLLVEVRSANGRSWIKAQVTGIERPPTDPGEAEPKLPPVVSVRCTVPRKRRDDGRPHVVQWRGCAQDEADTVVFKEVSDVVGGDAYKNKSANPHPQPDAARSRGRREVKPPRRYQGVSKNDEFCIKNEELVYQKRGAVYQTRRTLYLKR